MPDACTVTRPGGDPVFDDETGQYTPAEPVTVYNGPFRSRGVNVTPGEIDAAAQLLVETDAMVAFPVTVESAGITKNDTLTWTGSAFDPALVGKSARITGPFEKTSHAVSRKFRIEETS